MLLTRRNLLRDAAAAPAAAEKPIAIYHHGNRTDGFWKGGQPEEIVEALRAAGAGV